MDIGLYGRAGDPDSETMREYFDSRGIDYRMRTIDVDRDARREREDLDGEGAPVITIDRTQIVRGLDCTRLENFIGSGRPQPPPPRTRGQARRPPFTSPP